MDQLYKQLFELYKTDQVAFERERQDAIPKIKNFNTYTKAYQELVPYPEYDDPDFNKKIFYKKEFNRNKSELEKPSNDSFEISNNQKFLKNFMSPFTPYNGLLLFHAVGSGKTCSAISIAERYYEVYQKKILVVLSSNIKDNFKKQIFDINKYNVQTNESNLCTGTVYPDMVMNKSLLKPDEIEKRINKLISEKYQFMGYKELVVYVAKIQDKIKKNEKNASKHDRLFHEKISELFSDRLIIIDEAHNLRMPSDVGNKQIASTFINILKQTKNVKLLLMTATPMFNDSYEIISMLNLLLSNDKRPLLENSKVFDKNGNITESGEKLLIETSRGYVSFMRGENPYTYPVRLYPSVNKDRNIITKFPTLDIHNEKIPEKLQITTIELIGSKMSDLQKETYDSFSSATSLTTATTANSASVASVAKSVATATTVNSNSMNSVNTASLDSFGSQSAFSTEGAEEDENKDMQNKIQTSNIVYPGNTAAKSYGKVGFFNIFNKNNKNKFTYKEKDEILAYDNIATYSPKIRKIIDYILNSTGIVFVYSQYYYSGIMPLAIALEHIGFLKYNTGSITQNITIKNKFTGKRPAYIILSRDKDISPNNDPEIAMSKSLENKNGDVIKVIIVSKIGTEGIDFKRIREVHILEPWFNLSRIEQIIGRAVRTYSHIDLPPEERNVTIYMHAIYDNNKETIDLRMYRIADNKNTRIKKIEKILQENSIDCNLNKDILSFPKNKVNITLDITTSQGKLIKKFQLGDKTNEEIHCLDAVKANEVSAVNASTFNRVFIIDDIMIYKKYISKLYLYTKKSYTFEEIYKQLTDLYKLIDKEVLIYALDEMILDKYKIYNQSHQGYLIYRSDLYIFQYSKLKDTRMTIEERETINKVVPKLDLDKIIGHQASAKASASVPKESASAMSAENVIQEIFEKYKEVLKTYSFFSKNKIMDFVIDRISSEEFLYLVQYIAKHINKLTADEKLIAQSLIENELILFDKEDKIKYVFNYFENSLFCLRSDFSFKNCSPIDIAKIGKERYEEILARRKINTEIKPGIRGFMFMKGDTIKFKLKDQEGKNTKGFICTTAILQDLKNKIGDLDPAILKNISDMKVNKNNLCDLIELILRTKGKSMFVRV
jgi:superfamily II DNA or RNA helicase